MPLDPTHVRLKLLHACDEWQSSWVFIPLTGWHCKLRPNTEGMSARTTPAEREVAAFAEGNSASVGAKQRVVAITWVVGALLVGVSATIIPTVLLDGTQAAVHIREWAPALLVALQLAVVFSALFAGS
jgi:hypothetical protein